MNHHYRTDPGGFTMKAGSVIRIPDTVASRASGRADDVAREAGVKVATVRITEPSGETARILLLATEPANAMPKVRRAA